MTAIALALAFFVAGAAYEAAPASEPVAQTEVNTLPPAGSVTDENVARMTEFFERLSREAREARARQPVVNWVVRDADSGTWRPAAGPLEPQK
jgi:hypothetical protein